jgi:hypothetical protein
MAGSSLAAARFLDGWSLLFAREPEPDLDLDEVTEDLDDSSSTRSPQKEPRRTSSRRPIHWILFLLIAAIGALFAYDPELAMDVFGLGNRPTPPPPMTARPAPRPQPAPPAPLNVEPSSPAPGAGSSIPGTAAPTSVGPQSPSVAANAGGRNPLYSEGQRVVLVSDPALPTEQVMLSPDPTGTRPGPAVPAGATLTVMDGELRESGWMYSVRSPEGLSGWIPEKRLRPHN